MRSGEPIYIPLEGGRGVEVMAVDGYRFGNHRAKPENGLSRRSRTLVRRIVCQLRLLLAGFGFAR